MIDWNKLMVSEENMNNCTLSFSGGFHNETTVHNKDLNVSSIARHVFGIIVTFLVHLFLSTKCHNLAKSLFRHKLLFRQPTSFKKIFVIICTILIIPIISIFLMLAWFYKLLCLRIIQSEDDRFAGVMNSFDVFWCLEDNPTKSVINVLGMVESDSAMTIRDKLKRKLLNMNSEGTEKLFFRKYEKYGFYYWKRYHYVDLNQYVQIVDLEQNISGLKYRTELEEVFTEVTSKPLPYNNEGLFQILITKQSFRNFEGSNEYGIIFRIHHSVGDGVALLEFLYQSLADKCENNKINLFYKYSSKNYKENFTNKISNTIEKVIGIPGCVADGILRSVDQNSLHGPPLLGKMVYKWTDADNNTLTLIKEIKAKNATFKFSDIIAIALSKGLRNYFQRTNGDIPKNIATVLPVRLTKRFEKYKTTMKNDFSVTILDLPVKISSTEEVKRRCEKVRESSDPLTNHYFLKITCGILPKAVLKPMLSSNQATLVLSSLPGPETLTICDGIPLKSLVFFAPTKGSTGLTVTCLSYGGVLRLGVAADRALVGHPRDLQYILDGMTAEVERLHRQFVRR